MSMLEAECTRCKETFVPHGTHPEDLIHGETENGVPCGGIGVILGVWGVSGAKELVDFQFNAVVAMERHGMDFPGCTDPDCEFHHPEVRETGVYTPHQLGECKMMRGECHHTKWMNTPHCAEMICQNYTNKCPIHRLPA